MWGRGDLQFGYMSLGYEAYCHPGKTYAGTKNDICGDGAWGETVLEIWRLATEKSDRGHAKGFDGDRGRSQPARGAPVGGA